MKYWQAEQLKKYLGPHCWHQFICIQFLEEEFAFPALRNRCVPAEFFAPINNLARTQQQLPQEINRKKREDLRAELGFHVTERCLRDWIVRLHWHLNYCSGIKWTAQIGFAYCQKHEHGSFFVSAIITWRRSRRPTSLPADWVSNLRTLKRASQTAALQDAMMKRQALYIFKY